MRIVRYLAQDGTVRHAAEQKSGTCLDILGDLFHTYEVTDKEAKMVKLLSPIDPRVILGIGLNYKEHAKEQGVQLPTVSPIQATRSSYQPIFAVPKSIMKAS